MTQTEKAVAESRRISAILKQELIRLKEDALAPDDIRDDLSLFDVNRDGCDSLALDSLDAVELLMAVEAQFGVTVPVDVDFKELLTVNDIVAYVARLLNEIPRVGSEQGAEP